MLDKNKLDWIYNKLFTIRFFEERIKKIAKEKSVPGYLHTCIGSEAICVGVMAALNKDDWISNQFKLNFNIYQKNCLDLYNKLFTRNINLAQICNLIENI